METYDIRNRNESALYEDGSLVIRELLAYFWRLRGWIVAAVIVSLTLAFLYLRTQTPAYERTTWIKLNGNEHNLSSELSLLPGMSDISGNKRLDNEVFILKSPSLMRQVVERLGLNTRYYSKEMYGLRSAEYYGNNPFAMSVASSSDKELKSVRLEFRHLAGGKFRVTGLSVNGEPVPGKKVDYAYGTPVTVGGLEFTLELRNPENMVSGKKYLSTWNTPYATAGNFVKNLSISVQGKNAARTDIVLVSFTDSSPSRASDILDNLVVIFNQEARQYKAQTSLNIIDFIDSRLAEISGQLSDAEAGYKDYQSSRALVDNETQTSLAISNDMSYRDQLNDVRLQLQVLGMISDYMSETPEGSYRVLPANVGITDASLDAMIKNYNERVVGRERMVANSSESNPKVMAVNTELDISKRSIESSLSNLVGVYTLREKEIEKVLGRNRSHITSIPKQQLELQQFSRKMEVIEPLYLLLQQKREENQITMYGEADTFRVIEAAFGPDRPVAPNRRMIYLLALICGFLVCPFAERFRSFIRSKVETRHDVENVVDAPILAVLPNSGTKSYKLIPKGGYDSLSESFRMLRSTVQSIPDARVFQVTSSVLGEGKSFVAANLALSLAYVGMKVILVGMDLRKPALSKIFKYEADELKSLYGYLSGKNTDLDEIITPSGVSSHLDLLPAGMIPPNPNELLARGRHEDLISQLRKRYDYIILDSTPYFPVADSSIVNKCVDATLFVVRCDYTSLKLLREINAAAHDRINPIRNLNIVINDFNRRARKYRYGYGDGYGCKSGMEYGYGYGYGYGEKEARKRG